MFMTPPGENPSAINLAITAPDTIFLIENSDSTYLNTPSFPVSPDSHEETPSVSIAPVSPPFGEIFSSPRPSRQAAVTAATKLAGMVKKSSGLPRTPKEAATSTQYVKSPSPQNEASPTRQMEVVSADNDYVSAAEYDIIIDSMSMDEIKDHFLNLNAALVAKDLMIYNLNAELAVYKANMITEMASITASMDSKLEKLTETVMKHSTILAIPARQSKSYADITESLPLPSQANPKKLKQDLPLSKTEQFASLSENFVKSCFIKNSPVPSGLQLVHIEGFRLPKNAPLSTIGVVLEGIFHIPASKVLNVSVLNSNLIEVVIDSSCLTIMKQALRSPDSPLVLHENLNVRVPLSPTVSTAAANASFIARVSRDVERLKAQKFPLRRRIAALLVEYMANDTRTFAPPTRPSPILMSAFADVNMTQSEPTKDENSRPASL